MEKIFVSVLNMSISGSVIIAAVIIMRFLFKRLPRVYSYALWSIPAIRLLCPISVSSVVSFFNFLKPEVSENRMEYIAPPTTAYVAPTLPQNPVVTPMPPTYRDPMEDVVKEVPKSLSIGEIAGIIWALVAVGIIIWAAASYISVRLRVKDSRESGGYYVCENIPSPFVFGIFRPRIFLPSGLSEQDSECIVMHERTHIRRRDYLIKLLTVPILALHWFNPLVWLAIKLMTADMELSCDEQALKDFSPEYKKVYAGALLNVSMKQNGISLNGVLGFGESNIKSRIKGVLHMKKPKLWAVLAAVAAAVVLAVCLLTNAMGKTESSALPDRFDGYISLQKAKIPELHFDETADISSFGEQTAPKILFAKAEAGDVTAYLLGEGVYREEGESNAVRAIDLKVGISTDGRTINAAYPAPAEFVGASQAHYKIYAGETYLMGFDMELPIIELRYIGEGSNMGAFYAVKDGEPRLLTGDLSDIGGEAAGVCFKYNALDMRILSAEKENDSNLKYTFTPDSSAIEFTFDFDSIRADGYAGPHFTAKRAGAALSGNSEFEDIINRYMLFERIFRIDSLSFGSINGPDDREIGPEDGVLINGDIYYPVNEEGFTEWRQLEDFMRGLFTDELAEANLSDGHYVERDGKTFSLMAGGGGWYASPDYIYGTEELDDGRLRLDFYREWDRNEVGEYYTVKLILENTPDGYRIAEVSQDSITDYDSYDWLAPVNRFVQKEFYFNPDFTGRHDAEDAGESIISEIAHNVTVTFRYTSDGEFIDAFTDGREESVDEIYALDENRLLVYDWDLIARDQIYLLNFETGTTEPVLPDTAFGFSFNDYYDITGKYERIEWVTTPRISPDGRKILYESNKYAENGEPVYRLGLWVYDIQSGTEERIARPEEADPDMVTASYNWTEDGRVLFSCFSTGGEYVLDYIYDPATKETAPLTTAESLKNVTRNFDGQVISVDIPVRWQSYTLEDYSLQHVGIQIYDGDIPAQREMYGGKLFIASAVSGFAQSYIESQEALGVSYDVSDYTSASGYKMKLCYRDGVLDYATFDDFKSMCIFFDLDEQDDMSVIFGIIDSVVFSAGGESSAQTISYDEAKDILNEALEEYAQYTDFGSIELSSDGGTAAREIKVGKSDGIFTEYAYCFTARYQSRDRLPRFYAVTADLSSICVYDPEDEADEAFYDYLSSAESYEDVSDYVVFTDFYAQAQAFNKFLNDIDSRSQINYDPEATSEALSLGLWDDYKEASLFLHLERRDGGLIEFDGGEYIPLAEEYDTLEKCEAMLQRAFTRDFCSLIMHNQFGRHRVFVEHEGRMYAIAADYSGTFVCDLPIKGAVYDGENRMTAYTTITYDHEGDNVDDYIFHLEKENESWKIASIELPDYYADGSSRFEFTQSYYYTDTFAAIETVREALEAEAEKDYVVSLEINDISVDWNETYRLAEMYSGSELALERGWSDDDLNDRFLVVSADCSAEYDHTKTSFDDGHIIEYFGLMYHEDSDDWEIIPAVSGTFRPAEAEPAAD